MIREFQISATSLSSGEEGAKELRGIHIPIFPRYSLFNGEPRSYLGVSQPSNSSTVFSSC